MFNMSYILFFYQCNYCLSRNKPTNIQTLSRSSVLLTFALRMRHANRRKLPLLLFWLMHPFLPFLFTKKNYFRSRESSVVFFLWGRWWGDCEYVFDELVYSPKGISPCFSFLFDNIVRLWMVAFFFQEWFFFRWTLNSFSGVFSI